ncbi:PH domain-containing protein [Catenuloplanes atrovinosus]|uniref:Membrane protein YdbT with pleckstrin-like domain n=1 Tax=Catenuloplanes atrovinosus TaxID=137266 RepID=A0AAE3YVR0_9ACTN|nr:PH domain-containing protein [Catenuloplanes atrovinosus]MDR7280778.1 putative membrane protein YdbT with pleckstrin-like domain [Catenuloplanes atrovinosus]
MAFPEDVLTSDEHVVLHLHPHWKALIGPVTVTVLAVAAAGASFLLPEGWMVAQLAIAVVAVVLLGWLALWPFLVWRTTHYVFTNERVLLQKGVLNRDRRDIPLSRVNDHSMTQRLTERMLGCGTLTIESAGERGQSVLTDIPRIEQVQTTLYELVEADRDKHTLGDDELREALKGGGLTQEKPA